MNVSQSDQTQQDQITLEEEIIGLITENQNFLMAFIRGSVSDLFVAKDLLQEVNATIWRKSGEFKRGSNFRAWACSIAKFKILSKFRDNKRDILVYDDSLIDMIATDTEEEALKWEKESRLVALEGCIDELPLAQRRMILKRYQSGDKIEQFAVSLNRSKSAIKMILLRVRSSLRDCIEQKINKETPLL